MKYFIACLLPAEAAEYHRRIVDDLAERFGGPRLHQRIPPHITLKAPFDTNRIDEVEAVVRRFTQRRQPVTVAVRGLDQFDQRVLFWNITPAQPIRDTAIELNTELRRRLPELSFSPSDLAPHPHATLVKGYYGDISILREYIEKRYQLELEVRLSTISILGHQRGQWKVDKNFALSGQAAV